MTKRNGYEITPGDRWLFVGPKRQFPEGPEEVEIEDIQRGEVKIRFLVGRLVGKREWHRPSLLYAPIEHVKALRDREEHDRKINAEELSHAEEHAVFTVAETFDRDDPPLSGSWKFDLDPQRLVDLLHMSVRKITAVPLARRSEMPGRWHLPGTHQRLLARRLCEGFPELVHDYATLELDQHLRRRLRQRDSIRGSTYAEIDLEEPLISVYREPYLIVCSWCHVRPDCDRLDVLENQRIEIRWLFNELVNTIEKLGRYSPQARTAATRTLRDHYDFTKDIPIGHWPGVPPRRKSE
jgi:hypothetical protein